LGPHISKKKRKRENIKKSKEILEENKKISPRRVYQNT
jgi:hypothetical protein